MMIDSDKITLNLQSQIIIIMIINALTHINLVQHNESLYSQKIITKMCRDNMHWCYRTQWFFISQ